MRFSPNKTPKVLPRLKQEPKLCAEEYIAYHLADLGLRLHRLGRLEAYEQVISIRNELLASLDSETPVAASKPVQPRKKAVLRAANNIPVLTYINKAISLDTLNRS